MSKKIVSLFLALLMAFSLTAAAAETAVVTDMFGREVTLTGPVTRVIALEPSDCEILYALGCGDALVGRGKYCDYPADVLELPAVQSGTDLNLEEILALNPQVVIATGMFHLEEQISLLEQNGVKVIGTDANSISEVYDSIRLLGGIMGKAAEAEAIIADMQAAFSDIAAKSEKTDKTIYVTIPFDSASIDGVMVDFWGGETLMPGASVTDAFFYVDSDDVANLNDITNVAGVIEVWDDNTYDTLGSYDFTLN